MIKNLLQLSHYLLKNNLFNDVIFLFLDFNQLEFHISGLKEVMQKQENENKQLKAINDNLKKENEHASIVNENLLKKLKKLDKESNKNISRFVVSFC